MPRRAEFVGQLSLTRARSAATSCSSSHDPHDPGEADALVLGEPLHLAQERDVAGRVAPATTPGARLGVTRPSRSYWRRVWACIPANSAATEMTKTGLVVRAWYAARPGALVTLCVTSDNGGSPPLSGLGEEFGARVDAGPPGRRSRLDSASLGLVGEALRDDDLTTLASRSPVRRFLAVLDTTCP
jgi:hypothetical protein